MSGVALLLILIIVEIVVHLVVSVVVARWQVRKVIEAFTGLAAPFIALFPSKDSD